MRRTIIILFSIAIIISGIYAVPSQADTVLDEKTFDMAIDAPTREDYTDAKHVLLWGEKTIELLPDGGYKIEWRNVTQVLTFMGKKEMSNVKYTYDTDFESINITRARSITPAVDSIFTVVVSDETEINDITPPGLSGAGIYASLQQRVVTLPGVDDSSIVDIGAEIITTDTPKKPFGGIEILAQETPILFYKLTIIVPEGRKLIFKSANGAPEPMIEGNIYTWTIEDYDGFVPEPQGPRGRNVFPAVYYTTIKNWTLAADYIQKRVAPKILVDETVQAKTDEILGTLAGRTAIDSLTYWVARNIKFIELELGDAGYIPNKASTVLENGYGDTRDRTVVLSALLKASGFDPKIALLSPRNVQIEKDVPAIGQLSRMIVTVNDPDNGERIWLWTEDEYTPAGYLPGFDGETALLVSPGKGELVEVPKINSGENNIVLGFDIEIGERGEMTGSMAAAFFGNYAIDYRDIFHDASPRRREQKVESFVSNLGGGKLVGEKPFEIEGIDNLGDTPTLKVDFETEEYAFIQDEMMIFNFPENPLDFATMEIVTSLDEREEPLVLSTPFEEKYHFDVKIPPGYRIAWVSEPMSISNNFGEITVNSSQDGDYVTYDITLKISDCWIETEDYSVARDLLRAYKSPKNRMILLEKIILEKNVEPEEVE